MSQDSLKTLPVWRLKDGVTTPAEDCLINETPVSLVYNGISHVVLMATAQDLAELALGFSLTEGILDDASQLYDIEVSEACNGVVVNMEIATQQFQQLKGRRRNMSGRTGCGLCGIESLDAVKPSITTLTQRNNVDAAHITSALQAFSELQPLRQQTGSVHGAAWVNSDGEIVKLFEDAGRHNALDKLIGFGEKSAWNWSDGFVLVSSRASYEMVVKSAVVGIGCLVAVSAPTAFAVALANEANMTLVGFAKPHQQVIYAGQQFITVKSHS
jgi:FdhD protein